MQDSPAASVAIVQPAEQADLAATFDLARIHRDDPSQKPFVAVPRCSRDSTREITVCARSPEEFLPKLNDPYGFAAQVEQGMGLAAIRLDNGAVLAAEVEQVDLGNGVVSNRVMIRYKLKL
ncbi:hypothetical protein C7451_11170 [Blastomonas natatoria]|uniref:Uncharacterized protein n=1 Tax=Blastomonas natatoria TaxID=34015 RepID=A0A2V3V889_9SPHN|nr:hypothetical protein [Blastomonas natatoria]PXW72949.1 hypothetical protein C7451_11170 [Blastomonas natatoria]